MKMTGDIFLIAAIGVAEWDLFRYLHLQCEKPMSILADIVSPTRFNTVIMFVLLKTDLPTNI